MNFHSFGKIAVQENKREAFLEEAKESGLSVNLVRDNIYEFGVTLPTLFNIEELRKKAGLIGLKYTSFS